MRSRAIGHGDGCRHDDAMTGGTLITFALTPDEAISIINAQELGPIMAVTAQ